MTSLRDLTLPPSPGPGRQHNRQVILGHIRQAGQLGRAQLARRSGLSTQAVSNIIAGLEADGLLCAQGTKSEGRGLPAVQYALRADGGYALGVEVRPDVIFTSLVNLLGQPVASSRADIPSSRPDAVLDTLSDRFTGALETAQVDLARVLGAGVVMPGPFLSRGGAGSGVELEGWHDVDPAQVLGQALRLPVMVENDANAAAMAERLGGAARDLETYAYLYFGRGLGLGVVRGGSLLKGAHGNAGEIGQIPVAVEGRTRPLEQVASRVAVQQALANDGVTASTMEALDALYAQRSPALLAWADQAAEALGQAVFMTENLFDPQTIILGGAMPDTLIDHLIAAIQLSPASVAHRAARAHPRLMRGTAGPRPATRGAAALVINHTFTPRLSAA